MQTNTNPVDKAVFFVTAFAGTLAAATVYGLIQGGITGAVFGPFFALFFGIPVFLTTAIAAWSCWFLRFRQSVATSSGALTGLVCSIRMHASFFPVPYELSIFLATLLGGIGAGLAGAWFLRNTAAGLRITAATKSTSAKHTPGQFFAHAAAFAAVIVFSTWSISSLREREESLRQQRIEWELRPGRTSD